jgi:hypothetical protein
MLHTYCRMQLNAMCNLSYATTQICNCMRRMQLNFSCKRQLQNPKFLVVHGRMNNIFKLIMGLLIMVKFIIKKSNMLELNIVNLIMFIVTMVKFITTKCGCSSLVLVH